MADQPKVIVVGLDGATWDLIMPWVDRGKLPAFKKLLSEGAWSVLESTDPPITFPAIPSFITGVVPEKHGIMSFVEPHVDGRLGIVSPRKIKGFLDVVDRKICINLPLTYPAYKYKSGIIIAGLLTPDKQSQGFISPSEVKTELENTTIYRKYKIDIDYACIPRKEKKFLQDVKDIATQRMNLTEFLAKKYEWNLLLVYFTILDRVGHYLWQRDYLLDAYKHVDRLLSKFIKIRDKTGAYLVLFSDHGMGKSKGRFHVNSWLEMNSFLSVRRSFVDNLYARLLSSHLASNIVKVVPDFLSKKIQKQIGKNFSALYNKINFDKTDAYGTISGIYINYPYGSKEYTRVRDEIVQKLKNLKINGKRLNVSIITKKVAKPEIPDIIFSIENYSYEPFPTLQKIDPILVYDENSLRGWHRKEGIFLVTGEDIREGFQVKTQVRIWDLAPTILCLLNIWPPDGFDGRIVKDIFKRGVDTVKKKLLHAKLEKEKIKKAVKGRFDMKSKKI